MLGDRKQQISDLIREAAGKAGAVVIAALVVAAAALLVALAALMCALRIRRPA